MNRFPDFQTDLLFSETPPAPAEAKTEAPADPGNAQEVTATTTEPVPLAPQMEGVMPEPMSGGQTFLLVLFGLMATVMIIAMTRFGRKHNYGD